MPWLQCVFPLSKAQVADAEALLEGLGAEAISLEDAADEPILELGPDEIRLWQSLRLIALFPIEEDEAALRQSLAEALTPESLAELDIHILEDEPWEQAWLKDFHPMRFGERLWVCPSGHEIHESGAIVLDLDPGLAFGSGTHPSTAMCLNWLAGQPLEGKNLIDFGCGSGILAIAALKLGAIKAHGLDHDPQAIIASRDNAQRNHVLDALMLYGPQDGLPPKVDILVANILANTLIELAPLLSSLLKPKGQILLSGILEHQAEEVMAAYAADFEMKVEATQADWALLQGSKKC